MSKSEEIWQYSWQPLIINSTNMSDSLNSYLKYVSQLNVIFLKRINLCCLSNGFLDNFKWNMVYCDDFKCIYLNVPHLICHLKVSGLTSKYICLALTCSSKAGPYFSVLLLCLSGNWWKIPWLLGSLSAIQTILKPSFVVIYLQAWDWYTFNYFKLLLSISLDLSQYVS